MAERAWQSRDDLGPCQAGAIIAPSHVNRMPPNTGTTLSPTKGSVRTGKRWLGREDGPRLA